MDSLAILWAQYGPYHFARAAALAKMAGSTRVHALELADHTRDYQWRRPVGVPDLIALCPASVTEQLSFTTVFFRLRRKFVELGVEVCLLPSYSPRQSLAALLAAKSLGIRTVMMNDSHAGTARARGFTAFVKRKLVGLFDAALVAGAPQRRYFASLGLPENKIFTGYDAVDNDYFARRAMEVRGKAEEIRSEYQLPGHFFLSLGRFVAKKNLLTLIRAFRKCVDASHLKQTHLVMVGSGEEEGKLKSECRELGLPVYEKSSNAASGSFPVSNSSCQRLSPGVHFYGFRQIEENPIFYALADAFILPSLWEEWGLVVNEAMASGLPVVVSENAGCAEDLLKPGWPEMQDNAAGDRHRRLAQLKSRICRNGFTFNPKSLESLADALIALESDPALRRAMGKASQTLIESFSCDNFARNALLAARVALGEQPACTQNSSCTRVSKALLPR